MNSKNTTFKGQESNITQTQLIDPEQPVEIIFLKKQLIDRLTILRNGLIKNGENNKYLDTIYKWINNIDNDNILEDIKNTLYEQDIKGTILKSSDFLEYFRNISSHIKNNEISISSFFPEKTSEEKILEMYSEITTLAKQSLAENKSAKLSQYELSRKMLGIFNKMFKNNISLETASYIRKLGEHTDDHKSLNEIIQLFNTTSNPEMFILFKENHEAISPTPNFNSISLIINEIEKLCFDISHQNNKHLNRI